MDELGNIIDVGGNLIDEEDISEESGLIDEMGNPREPAGIR